MLRVEAKGREREREKKRGGGGSPVRLLIRISTDIIFTSHTTTAGFRRDQANGEIDLQGEKNWDKSC